MYLSEADADRAHSTGIDHYEWFLRYIEDEFANMRSDLKMLGLEQTSDGVATLRGLNLGDFHRILGRIFRVVARERWASVKSITDALLKEESLLFPADEHSEQLRQFTFACFGIATFIFKPLQQFKINCLAIESPRHDLNQGYEGETWIRLEQPLPNGSAPLADVICKFGSFLGPIPYFSPPMAQGPDLETIDSRELNFFHLCRLGGIKIRWADSLCQHLEFNRREKVLMVFRHPSYCAMLSYGQEDGIFLDR